MNYSSCLLFGTKVIKDAIMKNRKRRKLKIHFFFQLKSFVEFFKGTKNIQIYTKTLSRAIHIFLREPTYLIGSTIYLAYPRRKKKEKEKKKLDKNFIHDNKLFSSHLG